MTPAAFDPDRPAHDPGRPDPAPPAGTDPAVPGTDPTVPGTDPAVAGTGPTVPGTDPAVAGTDPAGAGPVAPPPVPRRTGRLVAVNVAAAVATVVAGVPLGLLWAALAPSVPVVRTADGAVLTQPEPEEFIAADGWFTLLGLGFGVLAATIVWLLLRRHRGPAGLVAVALGGVGAGVVAWQTGRRVGLADYRRLLESAPVGQTFGKPPDLRAGGFQWLFDVLPVVRGDLLLPAFAAVVTYTLLAGWSRWPSLRPEPEPVSSDWPAAPAP